MWSAITVFNDPISNIRRYLSGRSTESNALHLETSCGCQIEKYVMLTLSNNCLLRSVIEFVSKVSLSVLSTR